MRTKYFFVLAVFLSPVLGGIPFAHAQLFQNNDSTCESRSVVCSSVTGGGCVGGQAESISCRNIEADADITGNGFVDCVAGRDDGTGEINVSVLLNNGAGAQCGVGAGQFSTALDYGLSGLFTAAIESGTVLTGDLSGDGATDMGAAGPSTSKVAAQAFNPGGGFGADETILTTTDVLWSVVAAQDGYFSSETERNAALFDCDGDGDLEAAIAAETVVPVGPFNLHAAQVNVLLNSGAGLAAINDVGFPGTTSSALSTPDVAGVGDLFVSLAVGDFDGINGPDIVLAVNSTIAGVSSSLWFCPNDGACGFPASCTQVVDLDAQAPHAGGTTNPFSIAAGDFDGSGDLDVVVTEPGLPTGSRGVHYFFGNGDGTFNTPGTHVTFTGGAFDGSPRVVTTGCYNNDNVVDTATTFSNPAPTTGSSDVRVIT
ncbi:MAG: FG-GAP repeat domain-containing protein, partial [Bacteroidota bacterium]